ncbi:DUF3307 domain-containing protein [Krasilnikovia sp. MM14-A1259]|uniref:DUF3307 domain-containing protein n=1 Tax=Krasilnikovia sp. MM14-A1259 TaxID=3373539 RepID=UPI00382E20C1
MTEPTIATTAITAVVFAGLLTGHMIGDHPMQPNAIAAGKGRPADERLAAGVHPWTGWIHCLAHVSTYLACQAAAMVLLALVVPLTRPGFVAALAVSGATHAVIDRRWIVRKVVALHGGTSWSEFNYHVDQSLHYAAMLLAAVAAARATTGLSAAVVTAAAAALIPAALAVERHQGRRAAARTTSRGA